MKTWWKRWSSLKVSKERIHIEYVKTIAGELIIGSYQQQLCMLDYRYRKARNTLDNRLSKSLKTDFVELGSDTIENTKSQLKEYFSHNRTQFDLPLLLLGSDFQKKVWHGLLKVPFGTTLSYKQLAKNIGNEKGVRAVANANGANAIGIVIPCHRIIESNGGLGGYAGGLDTKKRLLNLEQKDMFQK